MHRYEVSFFSEDLLVRNPTSGHPRLLAFHATLILDAPDEQAARSHALSALSDDPQLAALRNEGEPAPTIELDSVSLLSGDAATHGPIFCFFQMPLEGAAT